MSKLDRNEGIEEAMRVAKELGCSFVMLGNGVFSLIDTEDCERVSQIKWALHNKGYVSGSVGPRRRTYLHRFILNPPAGFITDHVNGDRRDNRKCNLRASTYRLNQANKKPKSGRSTKFKGVKYEPRNPNLKWVARLIDKRIEHYLGAFKTELEAALAYDAFAIKTWGEFARPNFAI